jgi:hypothetical protein
MKLLMRNYLPQKDEAPSKVSLGLEYTESELKEKHECFYSNVKQGYSRVEAQVLLFKVWSRE